MEPSWLSFAKRPIRGPVARRPRDVVLKENLNKTLRWFE
jgi:hypothetical protein